MLPQALVNIVLGKLEDGCDYMRDGRAGLHAKLILRLVSKWWEEAARQYTGKVYTAPQRQTDLRGLIKILPQIRELLVKSRIAQHIEPVSALTQLSSLSISRSEARWCEREGGPLDMSLMPMGLVELKVSEYGVDPNSFQNLSSMRLTSLELASVQNSPTEICKLMECFPGLQVQIVSAAHI